MRLKLKRHYPILIVLVLVVMLTTLGIGNQRIIAYSFAGGKQIEQQTTNYTNDIQLFDNSLVHSIRIQMADENYQTMLTTYKQTGAKDYFHADVVIDGVQVSNVGVRLKGNASLRTAVGGGGGGLPNGGGQAPPGGGRQRPNQGNQATLVAGENDAQNFGAFQSREPGNFPTPVAGQNGFQNPGGFQPPDLANLPTPVPGQNGAQNPGAAFQPLDQGKISTPMASQNKVQTQIPLMIKFDEFVPGQTYQNYDRLAIRSAGISYDASMLQEPLTNSVFRLIGQPATRTAYAGIKRNDETEQLFTISEVIEEDYLEEYFNNPDGVLYKAELNANLNYQGEDPSSYVRSFTQETRVNDADLAPLIKFLKFLSESDNATFEQELPKYLDVDSFATYLAINNLLVNTDSMAGMGNNYYLYYETVTGRFTVLMWDANESLGKIGGRGERGGGGGDTASYDIFYQNLRGGGGGNGRGMGMRGGSNSLLTRFLSNETFLTLYKQKLQLVYEKTFVSGALTDRIEQYITVVRQANAERSFVDADTYEQAVASVKSFITRRSEYLATTSLLGVSE